MTTSPKTEAQPVEIVEADLDGVAGGGGVMLERRNRAMEDTAEAEAKRGIVIHE